MRSAAVWVLVLVASCANRTKRSVELYEAGDYAGAARVAEAGLAEHPDDSGLWQMRVRAALALGDAPGVAKAYAAYQGKHGDDRELLTELAIATLEQALASPSVKLKIAAIETVAQAEIQALADHVGERLGDDDDRVAAAAAVAVLRGYPQAPQVANQMLASEDPEARRIAVEGVGKKVATRGGTAGDLARADLQKLAGNDPDPRVRRAAIRWLGQLKDHSSLELVERNLRHSDDAVRAAAATALARIGKGDLVAFAQRALADKALAVRIAGVELLVAARHQALAGRLAAVELLVTDKLVELAGDPDPVIAVEAAIAAKRPELVTKALDRAVTSEDASVRAGAVNLAVRASGKSGAAGIAKKLIADPERSVRLAAARALAATDRAAAIAVFAAELTGESAVSAAGELAALGDDRGMTALDAMVRDREAGENSRASAASTHRNARRVTPGLVAALADSSGVVRVEAASALVIIAKP